VQRRNVRADDATTNRLALALTITTWTVARMACDWVVGNVEFRSGRPMTTTDDDDR
jgi:hypothetical protein